MSAPFGSTVIPALGMTFAEGAAKFLNLFGEHEADSKAVPENWPDHLVTEACDVRLAMFSNPPQTADDALAVLELLAHPEHGLPNGSWIEGQESAVVNLRDFMAKLGAKGVKITDTPPGTPSTTFLPQPPYPLNGVTPSTTLRGWQEAGAPILWREQPGARSRASRYTVMDCTIVGPFFLDVILQDEPDTPEAPFLWSLCRLLGNEFIIRGDETTLAKAKAAAEEAARVAMAAEPCEVAPPDPGTGAPATIGGAVKAFDAGRWGASFEAWAEYANDDRLEADLAILAERFRLALAAAGPITSMDDALALAALLHEVTEEACNPDCWPLYGARASVVLVIADALAELARRGLQSAGIVTGMPSLPPTAAK
ncbi:hypothetical protein ABNQ39_06940 [Azospirillum sp. A26]|uniref:hypothetical protein n=1 Tax=Azospirillum sp. A26 TaxID=3160607 RepID=UPI00366B5AA0